MNETGNAAPGTIKSLPPFLPMLSKSFGINDKNIHRSEQMDGQRASALGSLIQYPDDR